MEAPFESSGSFPEGNNVLQALSEAWDCIRELKAEIKTVENKSRAIKSNSAVVPRDLPSRLVYSTRNNSDGNLLPIGDLDPVVPMKRKCTTIPSSAREDHTIPSSQFFILNPRPPSFLNHVGLAAESGNKLHVSLAQLNDKIARQKEAVALEERARAVDRPAPDSVVLPVSTETILAQMPRKVVAMAGLTKQYGCNLPGTPGAVQSKKGSLKPSMPQVKPDLHPHRSDKHSVSVSSWRRGEKAASMAIAALKTTSATPAVDAQSTTSRTLFTGGIPPMVTEPMVVVPGMTNVENSMHAFEPRASPDITLEGHSRSPHSMDIAGGQNDENLISATGDGLSSNHGSLALPFQEWQRADRHEETNRSRVKPSHNAEGSILDPSSKSATTLQFSAGGQGGKNEKISSLAQSTTDVVMPTGITSRDRKDTHQLPTSSAAPAAKPKQKTLDRKVTKTVGNHTLPSNQAKPPKPTPKVRSYVQADVQAYLEKKKDERKSKMLEQHRQKKRSLEQQKQNLERLKLTQYQALKSSIARSKVVPPVDSFQAQRIPNTTIPLLAKSEPEPSPMTAAPGGYPSGSPPDLKEAKLQAIRAAAAALRSKLIEARTGAGELVPASKTAPLPQFENFSMVPMETHPGQRVTRTIVVDSAHVLGGVVLPGAATPHMTSDQGAPHQWTPRLMEGPQHVSEQQDQSVSDVPDLDQIFKARILNDKRNRAAAVIQNFYRNHRRRSNHSLPAVLSTAAGAGSQPCSHGTLTPPTVEASSSLSETHWRNIKDWLDVSVTSFSNPSSMDPLSSKASTDSIRVHRGSPICSAPGNIEMSRWRRGKAEKGSPEREKLVRSVKRKLRKARESGDAPPKTFLKSPSKTSSLSEQQDKSQMVDRSWAMSGTLSTASSRVIVQSYTEDFTSAGPALSGNFLPGVPYSHHYSSVPSNSSVPSKPNSSHSTAVMETIVCTTTEPSASSSPPSGTPKMCSTKLLSSTEHIQATSDTHDSASVGLSVLSAIQTTSPFSRLVLSIDKLLEGIRSGGTSVTAESVQDQVGLENGLNSGEAPTFTEYNQDLYQSDLTWVPSEQISIDLPYAELSSVSMKEVSEQGFRSDLRQASFYSDDFQGATLTPSRTPDGFQILDQDMHSKASGDLVHTANRDRVAKYGQALPEAYPGPAPVDGPCMDHFEHQAVPPADGENLAQEIRHIIADKTKSWNATLAQLSAVETSIQKMDQTVAGHINRSITVLNTASGTVLTSAQSAIDEIVQNWVTRLKDLYKPPPLTADEAVSAHLDSGPAQVASRGSSFIGKSLKEGPPGSPHSASIAEESSYHSVWRMPSEDPPCLPGSMYDTRVLTASVPTGSHHQSSDPDEVLEDASSPNQKCVGRVGRHAGEVEYMENTIEDIGDASTIDSLTLSYELDWSKKLMSILPSSSASPTSSRDTAVSPSLASPVHTGGSIGAAMETDSSPRRRTAVRLQHYRELEGLRLKAQDEQDKARAVWKKLQALKSDRRHDDSYPVQPNTSILMKAEIDKARHHRNQAAKYVDRFNRQVLLLQQQQILMLHKDNRSIYKALNQLIRNPVWLQGSTVGTPQAHTGPHAPASAMSAAQFPTLSPGLTPSLTCAPATGKHDLSHANDRILPSTASHEHDLTAGSPPTVSVSAISSLPLPSFPWINRSVSAVSQRTGSSDSQLSVSTISDPTGTVSAEWPEIRGFESSAGPLPPTSSLRSERAQTRLTSDGENRPVSEDISEHSSFRTLPENNLMLVQSSKMLLDSLSSALPPYSGRYTETDANLGSTHGPHPVGIVYSSTPIKSTEYPNGSAKSLFRDGHSMPKSGQVLSTHMSTLDTVPFLPDNTPGGTCPSSFSKLQCSEISSVAEPSHHDASCHRSYKDTFVSSCQSPSSYGGINANSTGLHLVCSKAVQTAAVQGSSERLGSAGALSSKTVDSSLATAIRCLENMMSDRALDQREAKLQLYRDKLQKLLDQQSEVLQRRKKIIEEENQLKKLAKQILRGDLVPPKKSLSSLNHPADQAKSTSSSPRNTSSPGVSASSTLSDTIYGSFHLVKGADRDGSDDSTVSESKTEVDNPPPDSTQEGSLPIDSSSDVESWKFSDRLLSSRPVSGHESIMSTSAQPERSLSLEDVESEITLTEAEHDVASPSDFTEPSRSSIEYDLRSGKDHPNAPEFGVLSSGTSEATGLQYSTTSEPSAPRTAAAEKSSIKSDIVQPPSAAKSASGRADDPGGASLSGSANLFSLAGYDVTAGVSQTTKPIQSDDAFTHKPSCHRVQADSLTLANSIKSDFDCDAISTHIGSQADRCEPRSTSASSGSVSDGSADLVAGPFFFSYDQSFKRGESTDSADGYRSEPFESPSVENNVAKDAILERLSPDDNTTTIPSLSWLKIHVPASILRTGEVNELDNFSGLPEDPQDDLFSQSSVESYTSSDGLDGAGHDDDNRHSTMVEIPTSSGNALDASPVAEPLKGGAFTPSSTAPLESSHLQDNHHRDRTESEASLLQSQLVQPSGSSIHASFSGGGGNASTSKAAQSSFLDDQFDAVVGGGGNGSAQTVGDSDRTHEGVLFVNSGPKDAAFLSLERLTVPVENEAGHTATSSARSSADTAVCPTGVIRSARAESGPAEPGSDSPLVPPDRDDVKWVKAEGSCRDATDLLTRPTASANQESISLNTAGFSDRVLTELVKVSFREMVCAARSKVLADVDSLSAVRTVSDSPAGKVAPCSPSLINGVSLEDMVAEFFRENDPSMVQLREQVSPDMHLTTVSLTTGVRLPSAILDSQAVDAVILDAFNAHQGKRSGALRVSGGGEVYDPNDLHAAHRLLVWEVTTQVLEELDECRRQTSKSPQSLLEGLRYPKHIRLLLTVRDAIMVPQLQTLVHSILGYCERNRRDRPSRTTMRYSNPLKDSIDDLLIEELRLDERSWFCHELEEQEVLAEIVDSLYDYLIHDCLHAMLNPDSSDV